MHPSDTLKLLIYPVIAKRKISEIRFDKRVTDGPTNCWTDRRKDTPSYRDARTGEGRKFYGDSDGRR